MDFRSNCYYYKTMFDQKEYQKVKDNYQKTYQNIGKIFSPALNEDINFSAVGFGHMIFKNRKTERDKGSQIVRFKLIPLAVKLISLSTTHQEFEELIKSFQVRSHKKKVQKNKLVSYWGIIAIINNKKIKVIIRRIGHNGKLHFWSVIPDWKTSKYRDIRLFHTMNGYQED